MGITRINFDLIIERAIFRLKVEHCVGDDPDFNRYTLTKSPVGGPPISEILTGSDYVDLVDDAGSASLFAGTASNLGEWWNTLSAGQKTDCRELFLELQQRSPGGSGTPSTDNGYDLRKHRGTPAVDATETLTGNEYEELVDVSDDATDFDTAADSILGSWWTALSSTEQSTLHSLFGELRDAY